MDPLILLPAEEIWRKILVNYTTPKDKHSALNTCKLWRGLLAKNQTEWMFQEIFPFLLKYLTREDILMARGVCKSWKNTIDSYLENDQPSIAAPGSHRQFTKRTPLRTFAINFEQSATRFKIQPLEALQRFQSQFAPEQGHITKNPFVSRNLHMSINKLDMEILTFFQIFGRHLYSLKLTIWQKIFQAEQTAYSPLQIAQFVWAILSLVPNLRKLDFLTVQDFLVLVPTKEMKKLQKQELLQFFESNPVPPLPQLNNLQLDVHHLIRQTLQSAYTPQLTKYVHVIPEPHNFVPNNLSNVTELAWNFARGCPNHHVSKLKNMKCQSLQRLYVYVNNKLEEQDVHCEKELLFEAIENFKASLTKLSISWIYFEPSFPKNLNLPFVQELCMEIGPCHSARNLNLSFLPKLTSLRKLKLVFWNHSYLQLMNVEPYHELRVKKEGVDLHYYADEKFQGGPHNSNVWELVPSLDEIEMQVYWYCYPPVRVINKIFTRDQLKENASTSLQHLKKM